MRKCGLADIRYTQFQLVTYLVLTSLFKSQNIKRLTLSRQFSAEVTIEAVSSNLIISVSSAEIFKDCIFTIMRVHHAFVNFCYASSFSVCVNLMLMSTKCAFFCLFYQFSENLCIAMITNVIMVLIPVYTLLCEQVLTQVHVTSYQLQRMLRCHERRRRRRRVSRHPAKDY